MSWKIYLIKHLDTDMKYVGITGGDLATRWEQHRADTNSAVYKALRTEGYRMTMELLEEVATKPEALKKEQEYIRSLGTATPDGWNRQVSMPKAEPEVAPKKWKAIGNPIDGRSFSCGYILKCRVCGGDYTHQKSIEVFQKETESSNGFHTTATLYGTFTDFYMDNNPSEKRNGLRVYFCCESCHSGQTTRPQYQVIIYQHKGQTFFETVYYIEDNS
jgi:predicted GIY-YIG superfamily endonuclease